METTNLLILGTGTAGSRAAYYLYQRGALGDAHIVAVDSDADQLAMLPTLPFLQVPPAPALPVGVAAEQARNALREYLERSLPQVQMMVIVTSLGGETGDFYTQAAMLYAQSKGIPAVAIAAMPHAFDTEEYRNGASQTLDILRAQHFDVLPLDCGKFGQFFPENTQEKAYSQAVRWIAEATIGYLTLFTQPPPEGTMGEGQPSKAKAVKFDEMPRGIFTSVYPTIVDQQNLDVPTYLRWNLEIPSNRN